MPPNSNEDTAASIVNEPSYNKSPTPTEASTSRTEPLSRASLTKLSSTFNYPTSFFNSASYVTLEKKNELYGLLMEYVGLAAGGLLPAETDVDFPLITIEKLTSFLPEKGMSGVGAKSKSCCGYSSSEEEEEDEATKSCTNQQIKEKTGMTVGLGPFLLKIGDTSIYCLHETVGEVVSSDCAGAHFFTHLVMCAPKGGQPKAITRLFDYLIYRAERVTPNTFQTYRWHIKYEYWKKNATIGGRDIDSVVLPSETKKPLLADVEEFLSPETAVYYKKHGIPFRRSYLFYGVPGSGKTSLIQGLATKYNRNICYVQPSHPDMTDESLSEAFARTPRNSILVLEDIDSLFAQDRSLKNKKSNLTFSGLLNALDGVGSSQGQIVVLTTNFRENLDAALIRNGRVDVHVEFKDVDAEQCKAMFRKFYPSDNSALAEKFGKSVQEQVFDKKETFAGAALQHFFVKNRKNTAEEAVSNVADITAEIERRKEDEKVEQQKEKLKNEKRGGTRRENRDEGSDNEDEEVYEKPTKKSYTSYPERDLIQMSGSNMLNLTFMLAAASLIGMYFGERRGGR